MTAPLPPERVAELAEALGEHRLCWRTATLAVCTCDQWARPDATAGKLDAPVRREHDAHVAAILAALADDPAQATLARVWDEGMRWGQLHWATNYGINGKPADNHYRAALVPGHDHEGGK